MNELAELPELRALDRPAHIIRLPDQMDVHVSDRVMRLVDSGPFRRLAKIRQLGLVSLVYPGATHSRFEHSLGVYRNAVWFLRHLISDPRIESSMTWEAAEGLLAASLLHDIGHWPYCHPIEDLNLPKTPSHESLAVAEIVGGEIAEYLRADWTASPETVAAIVMGSPTAGPLKLAASILSGPLDVDKIDYLYRDSLHAGVPYGRNFDVGRLVSSLCLNAAGDGIAISTKGKTAAELLVFARYVMFSEVYWHHAVRSATAMLQRAFFELSATHDLSSWWRMIDRDWEAAMLAATAATPWQPLVTGLFGERRLYKRWLQLSGFECAELYGRIARRPYAWTTQLACQLASRLALATGTSVSPRDVLVDAPPTALEVQFAIDVWDRRRGQYDPLEALSPVVAALARRQFDEYVKQVRIFISPDAMSAVRGVSPWRILEDALAEIGD